VKETKHVRNCENVSAVSSYLKWTYKPNRWILPFEALSTIRSRVVTMSSEYYAKNASAKIQIIKKMDVSANRLILFEPIRFIMKLVYQCITTTWVNYPSKLIKIPTLTKKRTMSLFLQKPVITKWKEDRKNNLWILTVLTQYMAGDGVSVISWDNTRGIYNLEYLLLPEGGISLIILGYFYPL